MRILPRKEKVTIYFAFMSGFLGKKAIFYTFYKYLRKLTLGSNDKLYASNVLKTGLSQSSSQYAQGIRGVKISVSGLFVQRRV